MEQYIKKSAVLAEIRKYKNNAEVYLKYHHNRNDKTVYSFEQEKLRMCELLSFIDTLEVKEVDLEKVFNDEYLKFSNDTDAGDYAFPIDLADFKDFAKHFFELGLKAQKGEEV